MNRLFISILSSVLILLTIGCTTSKPTVKGLALLDTLISAPNYANVDYWAAHPFKQDPSDSVPKPLRSGYLPDSSVDIFFIHPTTYTNPNRLEGWNAPVYNTSINAKTDNGTILFQASVFNAAGRVFSPRYRQAHLSAYYPITAKDTAMAINALELAYQDIKAAFEYYLANLNHGKPIIIAAHSQGSTHGKRLLKEFFEGKELKNKLVAAYLVGMPIERNYFNDLPPCINPWQTGCICSWRTFKEGYKPIYVDRENFAAIVTNPLTWDSSYPIASRDLNKGGVLLKFNKLVNRVSDAKVNGNVLWTEKPHFFGNLFYTTKNYHIADINLFYLSIRENAVLRSKAFRKK